MDSRTGQEWLDFIPDKEASATILDNITKQTGKDSYKLSARYGTLSEFINGSMTWAATPQGWGHWSDIFTQLGGR